MSVKIKIHHVVESKDADEKLGYEKGHKNSRGEDAPWVIRSHEDNRIVASFANKKDAEEHMKRMKQYSKSEARKPVGDVELVNRLKKIDPEKGKYIIKAFHDIDGYWVWFPDRDSDTIETYGPGGARTLHEDTLSELIKAYKTQCRIIPQEEHKKSEDLESYACYIDFGSEDDAKDGMKLVQRWNPLRDGTAVMVDGIGENAANSLWKDWLDQCIKAGLDIMDNGEVYKEEPSCIYGESKKSEALFNKTEMENIAIKAAVKAAWSSAKVKYFRVDFRDTHPGELNVYPVTSDGKDVGPFWGVSPDKGIVYQYSPAWDDSGKDEVVREMKFKDADDIEKIFTDEFIAMDDTLEVSIDNGGDDIKSINSSDAKEESKKSESREDGENSYDDYWTLIDGLKALGFEPSSHIRKGMIYPYRTRFTATKDGIKYGFMLNEDRTGEYLESIKVWGGIFDKGDPNDPDPTSFKSVSDVLDALKKVGDESKKSEDSDNSGESKAWCVTVEYKSGDGEIEKIDVITQRHDTEEQARQAGIAYVKDKYAPANDINVISAKRLPKWAARNIQNLVKNKNKSEDADDVTYELTEDAVTGLIKELGLEIVNTWYDGNKDRIVYDCKDKGDENGETVCVWVEPPYEARVWLKDVNPRVNQLVEGIETLDALKAALVDIFKIELGESHITESLRKPEDTIIVPNWLWETYTLGENYDGDTLTDDEQQTFLDFKEKYEGFSLKAVSEKTTFRSDNDFDNNGCPCYEVNVFKK